VQAVVPAVSARTLLMHELPAERPYDMRSKRRARHVMWNGVRSEYVSSGHAVLAGAIRAAADGPSVTLVALWRRILDESRDDESARTAAVWPAAFEHGQCNRSAAAAAQVRRAIIWTHQSRAHEAMRTRLTTQHY
jgi:hypothetical protein